LRHPYQKLPPAIVALIETMRENIARAQDSARKARPYWLSAGQAWLGIKDHPLLDEIGGIKALKPFLLPHHPQWLNRCGVACDGQITGDLTKGERWVKSTGYKLRNEYEPYMMAEIVEAYRNRSKPRPVPRLPLAISAGRLFVRNEVESFEGYGSVILGDCHKLIREIPDGIVDAVINDPPFGFWGRASAHNGKIQLEWDQPLDWDTLWPAIWRVVKPSGTVVISSVEPLTSMLIHAQMDHHLWNWRWMHKATNIFGPKYGRPLDVVEDIPVFSRAGHASRTYNPQMRPLDKVIERLKSRAFRLFARSIDVEGGRLLKYHELAPITLIEAPRTPYDRPRIMYGQKPVSLMRYLIRTHTNPGDVVLDFTAGSFTTAIACVLEGRKFIAMENYQRHIVLGVRRLHNLIRERRP
jgi:site-specific DNA-methyltransferase (adenine-specific)